MDKKVRTGILYSKGSYTKCTSHYNYGRCSGLSAASYNNIIILIIAVTTPHK